MLFLGIAICQGVGTILKEKGCNGIANERLQVLIDITVGHAHPAYNELA